MSASLFGDSDHCLFSYPVTPPSRWTNLDNGNGSFSRHTLLALSPRQTLRNNEKPRPIRKPHPAAPSLCSMTDPLSEPTNRLIKTDVVALLNHGEHEREVYARHSMDAQQDAINRILDGVESIQDVDRNIIVELRGVMAGTMPIEKFLVTPAEFASWKLQHELGGIEYNSELQRLIVKAPDGDVHGAAVDVITHDCFSEIAKKLEAKCRGRHFLVEYNKGIPLTGSHEDSEKASDGQVKETSAKRPFIVLEVAFSQSKEHLLRAVKKWLYGTDNVTKVVIAIDIKERGQKREHSWDLSDHQIRERKTDDLADHIAQWHRNHGDHLLGIFTAQMFFCTKETCPSDCKELCNPLWTYEFSLSGPIQHGKFAETFPNCPFLSEDYRHLKIQGIEVELPFARLETEFVKRLKSYEIARSLSQAIGAKKRSYA